MSVPLTGLRVLTDVDHDGGLGVDLDRLDSAGRLVAIGLLRNGTSGGRPSVGMLIELPDGRQVIAETTWRLLRNAVRALEAGPVGSEEEPDV